MAPRPIPTKLHAALDYVTAPTLALAPELFRLNGGHASAVAPRVAGVGSGIYSALTDYELGARKVIPMRVHLILDALSGAALAAAPWVAGSARQGTRHWLPHAIVGANEILFSLLTKTRPPRRRRFVDRIGETARMATATPKAAAAVAAGVAVGGYAVWRWRRGIARGVGVVIEEVGDAIEEVGDVIEDTGEAIQDAVEG